MFQLPVNTDDCSYLIQANATSVVLSSVVDIAVDLPLTITLQPGRLLFRYFFVVDTSFSINFVLCLLYIKEY